MTRKAGCCCGACSVDVQGEPDVNAICRCNNCKRRTGSAFGWSAYFADEQVIAKAGDFGLYEITGAKAQRRWFCAICGTTLLWQASWWPSQTGIAGGCFTETPLPEPSATVSNNGRCPWLGLPAGWRTAL
jgi:hypothetical protein